MRSLVQRFARNTKGRDLIIGDIHGCFTKMGAALRAVGFDPDVGDRLFSVGDLVDRGPESIEALNFLALDFVHAVGGNHEDMAARWPSGNMDGDNYRANGGAWMIALDREMQCEVAAALGALPVAIELETASGLVGIVHAECPFQSWQDFTTSLEDPSLSNNMMRAILEAAKWSRERITNGETEHVSGVRAVVVGHTPMAESVTLGNMIYIDTMGWRPEGHFTIIDADTLQVAAHRASEEVSA